MTRAAFPRSPLTLVLGPLTFFSFSCGTLPPLRGKIDVGKEAFAVFVGGSGVSGDLYAVRADGGPAFPITYTPVAELAPAQAPNGTDLAFLRSQSLRDSTPATVWVMNLLNGSERELELPKAAGAPRQVGWSEKGRVVIVRTGEGLYRVDAPPAKPEVSPVPPADSAVAESSLAVLLGDPVFARVVLCKRTTDLCLTTRRGAPGILAQAARDPVRWGTDSVAFLVGDNLLQIRPLAKGRPRALNWSNVPARPRQLTFFEGGG